MPIEQAAASLEADASNPVGLVLSGGGARGTFQVGVYQVLRSHPRGLRWIPDVLSGTSAGALNSYLIASGLSPEAMLRFWLELADDPPVVANERFFSSLSSGLASLLVREPLRPVRRRLRDVKLAYTFLKKHVSPRPSAVESMLLEFLLTARFDVISSLLDRIESTHLFDTSGLVDHLVRATGRKDLPYAGVRVAINTVDANTGRVLRIVNYPPTKRPGAEAGHYLYEPTLTPEMVLASASIPLLFNPVYVRGACLWDGGLLVNTPLAPAVALGAGRIVPVLVTSGPSTAEALPMRTFGDAIERLADAFLENAYGVDRKLLLDRNKLAGRPDATGLRSVSLFEAIRPFDESMFNAGSYLYFEREAMLAMYRAGQRAALAWLTRGPRLDGGPS